MLLSFLPMLYICTDLLFVSVMFVMLMMVLVVKGMWKGFSHVFVCRLLVSVVGQWKMR